MAKKWLDSIEKQRRRGSRIDLNEHYRHTYIHTFYCYPLKTENYPTITSLSLHSGTVFSGHSIIKRRYRDEAINK